jgi:hypothetical protein
MIDTVVLFAGHRADEPGRTPPRFPPECEMKARLAVRSFVLDVAAAAQGPVLGMAGAADGGDILFHEVCEELGIESEVCLALPAAEYVRTSVQHSWTERFHDVLKTHSSVTLEPGPGDVWLRDHEWQLRRAREQHPRRTVLAALLEPGEDDIPGGTSGMVRLAQESGVEIIQLDTREICR